MYGSVAGTMIFDERGRPRQPQHLGHVPVVLRNGAHAHHGVDDRRPHRADGNGEERRRLGLLEQDQPERQPGQRRDRPQHLHERIEHARQRRRHAEQEAERRGDGDAEQEPCARRGSGCSRRAARCPDPSRRAWRAARGCRACSPPTSAPATADPAPRGWRPTRPASASPMPQSGSSRLSRRFITDHLLVTRRRLALAVQAVDR